MRLRTLLLLALSALLVGLDWAWEARHPRLGADLPVLMATVAGLLLPRPLATLVGWSAGFLHGLAAAQNAGFHAATGAVAAFALSSWERPAREVTPAVGAAVAAAAALVVGLGRNLVFPSASVGADLLATAASVVANAVLAAPLVLLGRRVGVDSNR